MVQVPIQMQDMLYSHSCLLDDQFRKEKGKNNLVAFPESILLLLSLLWVDYVFEKLLWQMSENSLPSLTAEREPSFKALGGALKREDFSRFKPLKSKEYRVESTLVENCYKKSTCTAFIKIRCERSELRSFQNRKRALKKACAQESVRSRKCASKEVSAQVSVRSGKCALR